MAHLCPHLKHDGTAIASCSPSGRGDSISAGSIRIAADRLVLHARLPLAARLFEGGIRAEMERFLDDFLR
jgi:hypothetical protein